MILQLGKARIIIKQEALVPILILLYSALYYSDCRNLSPHALALPRFLIGVIIICSIVLLRQNIRVVSKTTNEDVEKKPFLPVKAMIFMLMVIGVIIAMPYLGFYVTVFCFLCLSMFVLGEKSIFKIIAITIALEIFVYLIFGLWLKISLPNGFLIQKWF